MLVEMNGQWVRKICIDGRWHCLPEKCVYSTDVDTLATVLALLGHIITRTDSPDYPGPSHTHCCAGRYLCELG